MFAERKHRLLSVHAPARRSRRSMSDRATRTAPPSTAPTGPAAATAASADATPEHMSHRAVLEALSGLLLALFVAMLSSTVVSNALPRIVADLEGTESGYTWIVVATMLTMTASTPVWGKLADLFSKKMLVQTALVVYSVGSLAAAMAPNMGSPIAAPSRQGPGGGG